VSGRPTKISRKDSGRKELILQNQMQGRGEKKKLTDNTRKNRGGGK